LTCGSYIRLRLSLERSTPDELRGCLRQAMHKAGAAKLMTEELIAALCDHALGSLRALMNMAGELLAAAAQPEAQQIDEKLFLGMTSQGGETKAAAGRRR
jgi:general secretion pathway protein A